MSRKYGDLYTVIEDDSATEYDVDNIDEKKYGVANKYNKIYMFNSDWEELITTLCYAGKHMKKYKSDLSEMLSNVDMEICDILHYLEFRDLDVNDMVKVVEMLQKRRRYRRKIKEEYEKVNYLDGKLFDEKLQEKVDKSFSFMEKMKRRKYEPRKLNELFEIPSLIA